MKDPNEIVDDYYQDKYQSVHGSGALGLAATIMHTSLERKRSKSAYPVTLELGCGNFQHYQYVEHSRQQYICADIRQPEDCELYSRNDSSVGPSDLEFIIMDAANIPLEANSVDRLLATCLIMHLADPLSAIKEWQRVVKHDGVIDFLVPCDPGFTTRLFRKIMSERAGRKHGVSAQQYQLVNAIEHINSLPRILTLVRAGLEPQRSMKVRYSPFGLLKSWNINAFAIVSIEPAKAQ
jgi:ubiquinone/menaquinone biosynthesis C-methylase UbiE